MQSPDSEKDEMTEVAEGEYAVLAAFPKEEGDANTLDEEVQRLLHIVGKGKGNTEMVGSGREVGDGVEETGAIQTGVDEALEDVQVAVDGELGG